MQRSRGAGRLLSNGGVKQRLDWLFGRDLYKGWLEPIIKAHKELEESGIGNIELAAVCDLNPKNADLGKREIERLFGRTPLVFTDLDEVVAHPDIAAVDVATDPSVHHQVAVPVLLAGKHALVEKPLGITIACLSGDDRRGRGAWRGAGHGRESAARSAQ